MGENNYVSFYSGEYSSLNPDYGNFTGYRLDSSQLGFPGSAQTANQLNEAINAIKQGVRAFEVTMASPEAAEQIPKQHFKEIMALTKLTGVKPSVHAPVIDAAGFGQRGWEGEHAREDAERRLFETVKKSYELDPKGNVPVVMHSSGGIPGTEWRPAKGIKPGEKGRFKEQKIFVIDQETGQIVTALQEERKFLPGMEKKEHWEKGVLRTPIKELENLNATEWENKLTNLAFYKKEADEALSNLTKVPGIIEITKTQIKSNPFKEPEKYSKELRELQQKNPDAWNQLEKASLFLENNQQNFTTLFHKAYKYGTSEQKKELKQLSDDFKNQQKKIKSRNPYEQQTAYSNIIDNAVARLREITMRNPPKVYETAEKFSMEKTAKTFGNIAFKSYKKFGENSPIIAVENMMQGMAFSRAQDMEKLINKTRKVFVEKAVEQGTSESEAEAQAEKIIGATWDVGHLNMMRKAGFTEEDVVKESERIAKLVKHVHITDNFGYSDAHLPPGMGNVPFKKIFEQLGKQGKFDKIRKIVEAPGFVQHFKKSPHPWTLAAFGAPIYKTGTAPYWHQAVGFPGSYFAFPMAYLPEKHFSTYGTGFSSLPEELGGQIPGTQSRFSGTQNT
jgi:hypothetical protein